MRLDSYETTRYGGRRGGGSYISCIFLFVFFCFFCIDIISTLFTKRCAIDQYRRTTNNIRFPRAVICLFFSGRRITAILFPITNNNTANDAIHLQALREQKRSHFDGKILSSSLNDMKHSKMFSLLVFHILRVCTARSEWTRSVGQANPQYSGYIDIPIE